MHIRIISILMNRNFEVHDTLKKKVSKWCYDAVISVLLFWHSAIELTCLSSCRMFPWWRQLQSYSKYCRTRSEPCSTAGVHFFLSFRVTYIFPWDFPTCQSRLTSSLPTLSFMEMNLFHHQLSNLHNAVLRLLVFEMTIIQTLLNWNKSQILTRCLN